MVLLNEVPILIHESLLLRLADFKKTLRPQYLLTRDFLLKNLVTLRHHLKRILLTLENLIIFYLYVQLVGTRMWRQDFKKSFLKDTF